MKTTRRNPQSTDPLFQSTVLCLTSLADLLWYSTQGLYPSLACLTLLLYFCLYPPTPGGQGEGGPGNGLHGPDVQGGRAPVKNYLYFMFFVLMLECVH